MSYYQYHFIINEEPENGTTYTYRFFIKQENTNNISITVAENGARIILRYSSNSTSYGLERTADYFLTGSEDFRYMNRYLRDAFRKCYILYSLNVNKSLLVNSILVKRYECRSDNLDDWINSDNAVTLNTYSHETHPDLFPFMTSVLNVNGSIDMGLNDRWREIGGKIITMPKSEADQEPSIVSMFSYWASKAKNTLCDRFMHLWTSANAMYQKYTIMYENAFDEMLDNYFNQHDHRDDRYKEDIKKAMHTEHSERWKIGGFAWIAAHEYGVDSIDKINEIAAKSYELMSPFLNICNRIEEAGKILSEISKILYNISSPEELYTAALESMLGIVPDVSEETLEQFNELSLKIAQLEKIQAEQSRRNAETPFDPDENMTPVFIFLTLWYPYYLRCNLIHGSRITELFQEWSAKEKKELILICYFLDRFLNDRIPDIFIGDYVNNNKLTGYNLKAYIQYMQMRYKNLPVTGNGLVYNRDCDNIIEEIKNTIE
ncbi:MAG: hypothetical protein ACI4KR_03060 [Ruminiclostridium sp.]